MVDSPAPTASSEFEPETPHLLYERQGAIAYLTFNRPEARNSMTWAMYEGLYQACDHVEADERVRVLVLRGAGDQAFVSGTDISQFKTLSEPDEAIEYERSQTRIFGRLERLQKPIIASIRGFCVGGGAAIATCCDIRIADTTAKFGVPIARTLGNTLSTETYARVIGLIGVSRTKYLMFTGKLADAKMAEAAGVYAEVVEPDELEERTRELAELLAANAPLVIRNGKEAIRRIQESAGVPEADDLVVSSYLSEDFREGVSAFMEKRKPVWKGR